MPAGFDKPPHHPVSPFLQPGTECSHERVTHISAFFRTTSLVRWIVRDYACPYKAMERMPGQGIGLN